MPARVSSVGAGSRPRSTSSSRRASTRTTRSRGRSGPRCRGGCARVCCVRGAPRGLQRDPCRREAATPLIEAPRVARRHAHHGRQIRGLPQPLHVCLGHPAAAVQQSRPQAWRANLHRRLRAAVTQHQPGARPPRWSAGLSAHAPAGQARCLARRAGPPSRRLLGTGVQRHALELQRECVSIDEREHPQRRHRIACGDASSDSASSAARDAARASRQSTSLHARGSRCEPPRSRRARPRAWCSAAPSP